MSLGAILALLTICIAIRAQDTVDATTLTGKYMCGLVCGEYGASVC